MKIELVDWIKFQDVIDERGRLTAIEGEEHTPFKIARVFYVHQVVPGISRGGHAHLDTDQVLVGLHGWLKVDVSDGERVKTFLLDNPGRGLYVPRMLWIHLYAFSRDGICFILANTKYDMSKSIRTWEEYLKVKGLPWREEPKGK